MKRCDFDCDLCSLLEDLRGRFVYIKFKCPEYFGTAGRVLDICDNLIIMEYIYGGITITCCENVCYIIPIKEPTHA